MLSALAAAPPEAGPGAGLFHLYSHALFKALLFLAIGWAGLVAGGTAATALRGSAAAAPLLRVAFVVGLVSLAGVPLVVGGHLEGARPRRRVGGSGRGRPGHRRPPRAHRSPPRSPPRTARGRTSSSPRTCAPDPSAHVPVEHPRPARCRVALWTLSVLTVVGGLVLVVTDAFPVAAGVAALGGAHRAPHRGRHRRRRCAVASTATLREVARAPARPARRPRPRRRRALPPPRRRPRRAGWPRVVAFLDTEVVDAYARGTRRRDARRRLGRHARAPRRAPGLGRRARRRAVVVLGVTGVLLWS